MNHIHRLMRQNDCLRAQVTAMEREIRDIRRHLTTSKFWKDPTIQVGDVDDRLVNVITLGNDAYADALNSFSTSKEGES